MPNLELPWDAISKAASGALNAFLAAPYIKAEAVNRILELLSPQASLSCVSRWRAEDLAAGVSDVGCRTLVANRGGEFRLHPSLHGKYYRFDAMVLVGSANLTKAGLGYGTTQNLEILCPPASEFDWQQFENQLLENSRFVSDQEFEWWSGIEVIQVREGRLPPVPELEGIEAVEWIPRTREPDHLWRGYLGYWNLIPGVGEAEMARLDLKDLALPPDMERDEFDRWVACSLLGSSFVSQVWNLWNEERGRTRTVLADAWGLSRSHAERYIQTAEIWLTRFLPVP